MRDKSFYRRAKRGGGRHHRCAKERKDTGAKNAARDHRGDRARRPQWRAKTASPGSKLSMILDRGKLVIVLGRQKGGATPRRPVLTAVIDAHSHMIVGFVVTGELSDVVPETIPVIRADKSPAFQSREVPHPTGRQGRGGTLKGADDIAAKTGRPVGPLPNSK